MRVLLVETHVPQAKALSSMFEREGFAVECTDTGADALSLLRRYSFDLVLLNLRLPDVDGTTMISRIRTAGHHTPVLALLGLSSPKLRLQALQVGADDVVEHDTDRCELLARMHAIIRRSRGFSQPVIRVGMLALDLERHDVTVGDQRVHLSCREFAVLQLLVLRKNMVMTKETIMSHLYGGMDEPEIKIIDVFVCKIRTKLAKVGLPNAISTVWGRGYTVRDQDRDSQPPQVPAVPQPTGATPHKARVFA